MTIQELEERLKKHDWYYEFSDDQRSWAKGHLDAREIQEAMGELKCAVILPLFEKYCPRPLHAQWLTRLQAIAQQRRLKN